MLSQNPDETSPASRESADGLSAGLPVRLVRTLVLDPDPAAAEPVIALLRGRGHDCLWAGAFAPVMEALRDGELPDCLIVRLNHATAPDAAEIVRLVRLRGDACHTIALTDAEESPARVEAWVKRGFDDFIPDPARHGESPAASRLAVAEHALMRRRERDERALESVRHTRRFEDIFQRAPEATLVVTAREGMIVEANAAAEHVLGFARRDLIQRYLSLVLPDLFDREDYDPRVLGVSDTMQLPEVRHRCADGTLRWLDVLITRIPWTPGQALLLKFIDVTEYKGRESRRLHEARMDAASRVMAGAARELGDALTSLRGNLDLLQRQPPARQEMRDLLQLSLTSCERAEDLGRRLSRLARAPHGGDLRRRPLPLRPLLERALSFALLNGRARPVLHLPEDLWSVEADEHWLAEAMAHLARNADDAMPQGGTLFVEARNVADERSADFRGPAVRIVLRDQGHGIAPEHLPRLFDPWFTTRQGREGMGLATAAATIRAHKGHIAVESTPGQGTTVTVWLPVDSTLMARTDDPSRALPDNKALPPSAPPAAPRRRRILFMDDEAPIRDVVRKILTAHGCDVHCTADGNEAIAAWRRARDFGTPFDLILVDLEVRGGMGGQEAVARLKGEFPGIKALLTTGYIDDILMETYRDHGFLGVIPKPFQMDRLVQLIGRLLGPEA